ncbi:MAG TPA: hypothetical protein VG518_03905 [Solirubrobacterales bacterium]|nr:hypothetical protein [Solirubrobacterales bacterium]
MVYGRSVRLLFAASAVLAGLIVPASSLASSGTEAYAGPYGQGLAGVEPQHTGTVHKPGGSSDSGGGASAEPSSDPSTATGNAETSPKSATGGKAPAVETKPATGGVKETSPAGNGQPTGSPPEGPIASPASDGGSSFSGFDLALLALIVLALAALGVGLRRLNRQTSRAT